MRILLAVLTALALPATAGAATVAVGLDGTVTFAAAAGEQNRVTVAAGAATVTVSDGGAPLSPGLGCTAVDAHTATCARGTRITVALGDGDDAVALDPAALAADVDGGAGRDLLDLRPGTAGALVALQPGTLDVGDVHSRIAGFEDVDGTQGDDTISGDDGPNRLDGGRGNDQLTGYAGGDVLRGGAGNDGFTTADRGRTRVLCGAGVDTLGEYDIPGVHGLRLARDCETILSAWGLLRVHATGDRVRLTFPHYGCPVRFRVGRTGPTATLRIPSQHRSGVLALPHGGRTAATLWARLLCRHGKRWGRAFTLLPA